MILDFQKKGQFTGKKIKNLSTKMVVANLHEGQIFKRDEFINELRALLVLQPNMRICVISKDFSEDVPVSLQKERFRWVYIKDMLKHLETVDMIATASVDEKKDSVQLYCYNCGNLLNYYFSNI